jgi:hypothetical protein
MANKDCQSKVLLDIFSVRLFLHDIFFKFELLARYFLGDSTHPPIKNQMVRPLPRRKGGGKTPVAGSTGDLYHGNPGMEV